MVDLNFRELFPSPFAFANFGESARGINKRLVDDINNEMANYQPQTQTRTFAINECGWQSGHLETLYESFKEIGAAIQQCVPPMLIHSGAEEDYAAKLKVEGIWANVIFAPGGFSQPHVHGNGDTLWTGVYYPAGAGRLGGRCHGRPGLHLRTRVRDSRTGKVKPLAGRDLDTGCPGTPAPGVARTKNAVGSPGGCATGWPDCRVDGGNRGGIARSAVGSLGTGFTAIRGTDGHQPGRLVVGTMETAVASLAHPDP